MRRRLSLVLMLVCGSAAGQSLADRGPPPQRLFHRNVIAARVNQPGEPHENDNATQRLGPLLAYTFSVRDGAAFTAPTVFVLVQWWLDHRYRTGAEISQGLPLIGVGFGFRGDLLPFD